MELESYPDINRAALVVKFKKPFIDWLIYTSKEHDGDDQMRPEEIETDGFDSKRVYLIPAFEENKKYDRYLRKHAKEIFEDELMGWYTEPAWWPHDRSFKVFKEWYDYEIHTMVLDTVLDEPLEIEE